MPQLLSAIMNLVKADAATNLGDAIMSHLINRLWKRVTAMIAVEVPADMAACEFDCRELECEERRWESCPQRLEKSQAIAEMAPAATNTHSD